MKKILIPLVLSIFLVLAACGKTDTTTTDTTTDTGVTTMTTEMELIVGTFKLEGTENAVTSDEAADLLPLWQAYTTLSQSDTTAQEELDALVDQIKETMGTETMNAIEAMNLTQEDVFTFMQENGMMGGGNATNASGTPMPGMDGGEFVFGNGMPQGEPPSGFIPQGGGTGGTGNRPWGGPGVNVQPGAGGNMSQGGGFVTGGTGDGMDPSAIATMQASGVRPARRISRVPVALVQALIDLLETK